MATEAVLTQVIVFVVSLIILAKSSEIVIENALKIGRTLRIGEMAIGFLLIAVATSLPELMVSINAGLVQEGGIIIGTVIGSNITNILFVLGMVALFGKMKVEQKQLVDNAEILLLITLIPLLLLFRGSIGFFEGLILLVIFGVYALFVSKQRVMEHIETKKPKNLLAVLVVFTIAMVLLIISAGILVDSAADIALMLDIPASIIGLTLIAFGTSLPELAIAINAIRKGHAGLALGDVLGSCVVNLTLVLGAGAMLSRLTINPIVFETSILFLIAATVFLTYSLFKFKEVNKQTAIFFIIAYMIFILTEFGLALLS